VLKPVPCFRDQHWGHDKNFSKIHGNSIAGISAGLQMLKRVEGQGSGIGGSGEEFVSSLLLFPDSSPPHSPDPEHPWLLISSFRTISPAGIFAGVVESSTTIRPKLVV